MMWIVLFDAISRPCDRAGGGVDLGKTLRGMWQVGLDRHAGQPLSYPYQADLVPEHSEGPCGY